MKKIFTFAAAMLASLTMMAQTTIFSYTVVNPAAGTYEAEGGSAKCTTAMASGGSNELTIGTQTFYKFNSSSAWEFTLADGTFAEGDVITITAACHASDNKSNKGVKLNDIAVTGNFPAGQTNTLVYTVQAGDAIAGQAKITVKRNDSDIKFGTITITRPAAVVDPVSEVTIAGPTRGTKDYVSSFSATTDVKADAYQWYVNDVAQNGAIGKTFDFTPAAAGDYSIVCKARNANNAADEWIASAPIAFKALNSLCGELIKATLKGGNNADMSGVVGGTFDSNLGSGKYKLDKNTYIGIQLATGNFQEGDTVVFILTAKGSNYPCLFSDKERTNCLYLATETSDALEYKIILPAAANSVNSLYIARASDAEGDPYKWNPTVASISVIRPMATKLTVEDLSAVTIDGDPFDPAALSSLKTNHSFNVEGSYVNAPKVKFSKEITITYEDDSEKVINDSIVVTATENAGGKWEAKATINEVEYTITMGKTTSHVVTYMDGEIELGTENVEVGGHPADYAQYQSKQLCSFVGWYSDAALETPIADMAAEVINSAKTYYAKFENAYATSFNFEKAVMENGKSYNFLAQLGAQYYATNIKGSLDSLDNSKSDKLRNYAYLGLKVKQSGALLNFRLAQNSVVKIKFGNIAKTPQVSINGGEYADMEITDKVYTHTAEADELISIKMMDGNAVVFQQIMINEELQTPELLAITYAETEHGTVGGFKLGIPGESIVLTIAPDSAYHVGTVTAGNEAVVPAEDVYSFVMPGQAITVSATFVADDPVVPTLYTVTLGTYEHGNVAFIDPNEGNKYEAGAEVRLSVTPDEGYELEAISLEGIDLAIPVEGGVATFSMPAQDVTVLASFKAATPEPVLYTVTLGTYVNGTVAFIEPNEGNKYEAGAEVRLSVTPDEGYEVETVKLEAINQDIPVIDGVATFNMPAQDVVVLATFKPVGEGFEYIDASTKAVKFFDNGKLLIKRGDKVFDAKGQIVE